MLLSCLMLVAMAFVYVLIITGDDPAAQTPPSAASSAAISMPALPQSTLTFSAENAFQAFPYFPAPVLTLDNSDLCSLHSAVLEDFIPEDYPHPIRRLTLTYSLPAGGGTLSVSSIYPAAYLSALSRSDLLPSTDQDWTLAGLQAVCMSHDDYLHLHAVSGEILYQVEGSLPIETFRSAVQNAALKK